MGCVFTARTAKFFKLDTLGLRLFVLVGGIIAPLTNRTLKLYELSHSRPFFSKKHHKKNPRQIYLPRV